MAAQFWSIAAAEAEIKKDSDSLAAGYVVAVLTWLVSAGVYIAAKWAIAEMPPWTLCFWRVAIAALVLLPLVRHHFGEMGALLRRRWFEVLWIGGVGLALCQGLLYTALQYTTAVNAGLIFALMPIFSLILARIVLGEPLGLWKVVGSAIAFCGMVVVVVHGSLQALLALRIDRGEMIAVVAALLFPIYSVFLKRAKFELPRLPLLVLLLGGAAITALPFWIYEIVSGAHTNLDVKGYLALAYCAIPGGALMYLLFNWSVDVLGASRTGATMYLQTVFVAILAYFLLGEAIEPYHLAGAALIVIGVILVLAFKSPAPAAPAAGYSTETRR